MMKGMGKGLKGMLVKTTIKQTKQNLESSSESSDDSVNSKSTVARAKGLPPVTFLLDHIERVSTIKQKLGQ